MRIATNSEKIDISLEVKTAEIAKKFSNIFNKSFSKKCKRKGINFVQLVSPTRVIKLR